MMLHTYDGVVIIILTINVFLFLDFVTFKLIWFWFHSGYG